MACVLVRSDTVDRVVPQSRQLWRLGVRDQGAGIRFLVKVSSGLLDVPSRCASRRAFPPCAPVLQREQALVFLFSQEPRKASSPDTVPLAVRTSLCELWRGGTRSTTWGVLLNKLCGVIGGAVAGCSLVSWAPAADSVMLLALSRHHSGSARGLFFGSRPSKGVVPLLPLPSPHYCAL